MSRVLVTGATGFVASRALPLLVDRGFEVHAVSRARRAAEVPVAWHTADLLEPGAADALVSAVRPTHLLHFAWVTTPGEYWTTPENVEWVEASLRLVRAFAAADGTRAVFAGSCAEYDWSYGICVEGTTPLGPRRLYGVCKNSLREIVDAFGPASGLSTAWGRVFFLYGPGEHPARLVPSVARALLAGVEARCSDGHQIRDFLHVDDVAAAFVRLLESDVRGPVNIASGTGTSVRDVVAQLAA
ncbi:MAG: NAD-dependent epimerase/dehydratase family protein, partial [Gemmatimonadota bacterium]|nr:NAD-dependent epimerase/dehydratase family protein [Gemmatimonadota bacterium]